MRISKFMTIRVPILLILTLTLLLFGCSWPFGQETNSHVEIIVPENENIGHWFLSPGGDKIIYGSTELEATFLLYLENKEKRNLDFCTPAIWLDDSSILCKISGKSTFVLATEDFTPIPLKAVETTPDTLDKLLSQAAFIYRYGDDFKLRFEIDKRVLYLLGADYKENPDENYQIMVENIDEVLQGYDYITIPRQRPVSEESEHSPNGDFYYHIYEEYTGKGFNIFLTIYDVVTSEKLAEYEFSEGSIEVGGWAADNSGVYFQPLYGGGFSPTKPGAIMKLKVSQ
jgi:hypothetical protein